MEVFINGITIGDESLITTVNLKLEKNHITVICGENGSGKTLLLKKVFMLLNEQGIPSVYVDQDNQLVIPGERVDYNLSLTDEPGALREVHRYLELYGCSDLLKHSGKELSGGELRMVSVIRGLLMPCEVIIIDEPTNDLDYQRVELMAEMLSHEKENRTILIVSHDDRITDIADEIYEIRDQELCLVKGLVSSQNDIGTGTAPQVDSSKYRRIFSKHIIPDLIIWLLFLITSAILCNMVWDYENDITRRYLPIPSGEVDIAVPIGQGAFLKVEGGLPLSLMATLDPSMSVSQKKEKMERLANEERPIYYRLEIPNDDRYQLFHLEYLNMKENQFVYSLDQYYDLYSEYPDTFDYFIAYQDHIGFRERPEEASEFDPEKLLAADLAILKDPELSENLTLTYLVVLLEDMNFYDFVRSEACQRMMDGDYYIRSNETITIINEVNNSIATGRLIRYSALLSLLMLIMSALLYILIMHMNKRLILIYRNIAVPTKNMISWFNRKYTSLVPFLIIIGFFLTMFWIYNTTPGGSVMWVVPTAFGVIGMILADFLKRCIIKAYIRRLCNWEYRY